jgi:hypothetical protein
MEVAHHRLLRERRQAQHLHRTGQGQLQTSRALRQVRAGWRCTRTEEQPRGQVLPVPRQLHDLGPRAGQGAAYAHSREACQGRPEQVLLLRSCHQHAVPRRARGEGERVQLSAAAPPGAHVLHYAKMVKRPGFAVPTGGPRSFESHVLLVGSIVPTFVALNPAFPNFRAGPAKSWAFVRTDIIVN